MSIATTTEPTARQRMLSGEMPFLLRRLHSLTGIFFGGFVMAHLLANATLIEGFREGDFTKTVYQKQVDTIHHLPFLTIAEWTLIYLPILYHTVYGLWLTYTAQPNVNLYPYSKNVFYVFQRLSALVLTAFIFFHITSLKGWYGSGMRFTPSQATETVITHLNISWFIGWFVYPLGILAACYHLANGFWTAAISWGVTISAGAQRRWGWACVLLFLFTFSCGMMALVGGLTSAAMAQHH